MVIGTICSLLMGVSMPIFALLWGQILESFGNKETMVGDTRTFMLQLLYLGLGSWVAGWAMMLCWSIAGERQSIACRKAYLYALFRQEISWFDVNRQEELSTKYSSQLWAFEGALR